MNEQTDTTYTRNSITLPPTANVKTSSNGIASYTVTSLNEGQSLVFDLEYKQIKREQNKSETNDEYSAKLRFYPRTNYFIEGGYRLNNGGVASDKGNTFELGAGYSFTPRLGVIFSTSQFNGDVSAEKSSSRTSSLTVGYRF
jgi:predicted porin